MKTPLTLAKILSIPVFLAMASNVRSEIVTIPDALDQTGNFNVQTDVDDIIGEDSVYLVSTMTISNPDGYLFGNLFIETSTSAPGGAGQQRLGVGNVVNTNDWGINGSPGNLTSGVDVVVDTPTTMVAKINQLSGAWSFWINPDLSQPEPETADLSGTTAALTDGIGFVRLRGGRYGAIPVNTNLTDFTNVALYTGDDSPFNVPPGRGPILRDFTYDPTTGEAEVSIEGDASTAYLLVEAADLDFENPDQTIAPTAVTVGSLNGTQVVTDADGDATVQFNLGTSKDATFVRAESAPPPPPLLSEDFETGLPATWTTTDNGSGTAWSVGTPNGTSSTEPDASASGAQCAGSNINGNYTNSAEASLVSPSFTVPVGGATLNLSLYIDTEAATGGQDFGSIRLLSAADNTPLAGGEVATDLQGISESWTSESLPLPAAAIGLEVKIEFRFESDDDDQNFAGFYIDDVVVTAN